MSRLFLLSLCGCPFVTSKHLDELRDADGDGVDSDRFGGEDCDDGDATVFPGAPDEWYDGVIQDCDRADDYDQDGDGLPGGIGGADCDDTDAGVGGATEWHLDQDGDGFGAREIETVACEGPGLVATGTDCDDTEAGVGDGITFYRDRDGDGFGVATDTVSACEPPGGYAPVAFDCDDTKEALHPLTLWFVDADQDTFGAVSAPPVQQCEEVPGRVLSADDCDDADPAVFPGAGGEEPGDGVDTDCSGGTDLDWNQDGLPDILGCDPGGNVLLVSAKGPYTDIQSAVDDAQHCDVIEVDEGTWAPFVVDRAVAIVAAPGAKPVVSAGPGDQVVVDVLEGTEAVTLEQIAVEATEFGIRLHGAVSFLGSQVQLYHGAGIDPDNGSTGLGPTIDLRHSLVSDTNDAIRAGAEVLHLEDVLIEDAQSLGSIVVGGRQSTSVVDTTFRDDAALVAILDVSGDVTLAGVTIQDCLGVAIDLSNVEGGAALDDVHIERSASVGDYLVRVAPPELGDPFGSAPHVDARGWRVHDNLLAPAVQDVLTAVSGRGLVVFDGVDLLFQGGTFRDNDVVNVLAPDLQVLTNRGVGTEPVLLVRNTEFSASGDALWMEGGRIENATFVDVQRAIATDESLEVVNTIVAYADEAIAFVGYEGAPGGFFGVTVSYSYDLLWQVDDIVSPTFGGGTLDPGEGNLLDEEDPAFLRWSAPLDAALWDLRPHPTAPVRDLGDPALLDPDGTRSAIGATGGPYALPDPDADLDGMYDSWEIYWLGTTATDGTGDADGDTLTDETEFDRGTLPTDDDTDGDGVTDDLDATPLG